MENVDRYGWISLHRKLREHWIWDNPVYLKGWIAILMQVNHEDNKVLIQGELIECKRGQSLLSSDNWSDVLGKRWTRQKVRTFFELLKKDSMIVTENMRKTTRLTVCNYDKYQNSQPADNQQTTSRQPAGNQQTTTNNNDLIMNNNENNFFSEKVNLVFNEFLKNEEANKRMMTEARLKILVEHLNNIAHTDEEKIAVIKQAIEGNFSMFHSLPKGQSINNDNTSTFTDYIHAPSEEEFIKYFEENSRSKELAKKVYDDFAYNKKWKDKAGFSIKENWKEILKQYDFYDNK